MPYCRSVASWAWALAWLSSLYDTLKFSDNKVILPGGTKEGLKMLPEFKYATG